MSKKWQGSWIMDPEFHGLTPIHLFHRELEDPELREHREDLKNHHMLVRKNFIIPENFNQAQLNLTADDYYKLYINGQFVGQGPAPSYYFNYYYNSYDITEYLQAGENVIAVHLYYQGLLNRVWNSGDYRQGMTAELNLDNELYLTSDASWKYKISEAYPSGGTTGYETQFLENFDSRNYERDWNQIDFNDNNWDQVMVKVADDHKLYPQPTPPLEVYEIEPEIIEKLAEGHYFIDFGQEITGQFKMKAGGNSGEEIEIRCGEELKEEDENRVKYEMRCDCTYQEFWKLSGEKEDILNHYDYKAFRYVEILGNENTINSDSFKAVVRHYPVKEKTGLMNSSSDRLNQVWEICKKGVKYGSQEGFLDCPSREKGQYLGDATVTGHSHLYISGDLRLYKKAVQDFALSTFISPGMMAVAPGSLMQEIADYSLQWPYILLRYYQHSGDLEFLKEMYPVVEALFNYYQQYRREDGLLEEVTEQWNLVDWPENLRDDYDFELSKPVGPGCHNVINAFYLGMVKTINQIKDILDINYENKFTELKSVFLNTFYDSDKKLFVDTANSDHSALHSQIIPLFYDLVPEEAETSVINLIKEKRLNCGVYMSYFLLKGLARAGAYDLIFELITSEDKHSWGNMIKEGATTCFEAWGKEQKWNTSLCHAWASAPIPVLIEDIVGLKPAQPGWEKIDFSPQIPEKIDRLNLKIRVKTGIIEVKYEKGDIKIEAPDEVKLKQK